MKEELVSFTNELKSKKEISSYDEQATKQAIVLRILSILGWQIFDTNEVYPEYALESQRVDYSLRINNNNKVFIEAKRIREELESHHEQLLQYSFKAGVGLAVLTNGVSWWFYLPLLQDAAWEDRKFYTIDLLQQESQDVASKFIDLLYKDKILSGEAIENAKSIYESQQKKNVIRKTLTKAWNKIISESQESLVNLLADTTEKLCGHTVDNALAKQFLLRNTEHLILSEKPLERSNVGTRKSLSRKDAVSTGTSRTALCLTYLKELRPEVKHENIKLLIEIDKVHKHIFDVDWNHLGKELLVFSKSGIHQKPSNAAKEVFGKDFLQSYANIARKNGMFVDTSTPAVQVIVSYADVEKHIAHLKQAGVIISTHKTSMRNSAGSDTFFDSITPHKQKRILGNIVQRRQLWNIFLEKKKMTSAEFKKHSKFKPKAIAGFVSFLTRNKIATRFADTFTLNEQVIPQIEELLKNIDEK